tara:strand:+ start:190 stop:453 length:264 start_codon:yes stop_codon:yes gene_type:complete
MSEQLDQLRDNTKDITLEVFLSLDWHAQDALIHDLRLSQHDQTGKFAEWAYIFLKAITYNDISSVYLLEDQTNLNVMDTYHEHKDNA